MKGEDVNESLVESISIQNDYFVGSFLTHFTPDSFHESLRSTTVVPFNDEVLLDLQIAYDENYVNDMFLRLFHQSKRHSLTESIA